jgi:hypothetical protein
MYRLTEEQIQDIRGSYQNGVSPKYLYNKYDISKFKFFKIVSDLPKQSTRGYNGERCDKKMEKQKQLKE